MNHDEGNDQAAFRKLKEKSLASLTALFVRQLLVKVIFFIGNIALARMLAPEVFGVYAIVSFVAQFFSTFGDVGIGAALIQKKGDLSREELSTTFWLQQMLMFVVAVVIFACAPFAIKIYPSLPPVGIALIRAMAFTILLSSLKTIPSILMERELNFSRIAWVDVTENLIFQAVAITFASQGFAAWSFIFAAVSRALFGALVIYTLSSWRPSFVFRPSAVKELLHFGLPFQGNQILSFTKDAVTPLFVGAYSGATAVGYVNWARNFAFLPLIISETFGRVAFPAFAKIQGERVLLSKTVERSIRVLTFIMLPITALLVALAPEITHYFYTDKWLPAVTTMYVFATTPLLIGITIPMVSAILCMGLSKPIFYLNILLICIEWGVGVPLTLMIGYIGIAFSQPISYVLFMFLYKHVLSKHKVEVNIFNNIKKNLVVTFITFIVIILLKHQLPKNVTSFVLVTVIGSCLYLVFSKLVNNTILTESLSYLADVRGKRC